jgi:hypothetical protein
MFDYSTSMYYTFSTIAQVLASFLALSSVFVIFKIQELRKMHLARAQAFLNHLGFFNALASEKFKLFDHRENLGDAIEMENVKLVDQSIVDALEDANLYLKDDSRLPKLKQIQDSILPIALKRKQLIQLSFISMMIGVTTILFSIRILTQVPRIIYLHNIVFCIGITGTALSIGFMILTILIALTELNLNKESKHSQEENDPKRSATAE